MKILAGLALLCSVAASHANKGTADPMPVPLGDQYGYIDPASGKPLSDARWDSAYACSDGLCRVETGVRRDGAVFDHSASKWGMVDHAGKLVVAAEWDAIGAYAGGLAPVKRGGRWGYVDHTGTLRIPLLFLRAQPFAQGRAAVEAADGAWLYIDTSGAPKLLPAGADMSDVRAYQDGLLVLDLGSGVRVHDLDGAVVYERAGFVRDYAEGLAAFRDGSSWGFLDRAGKVAIEPRFQFAWGFAEGLAPVQLDGKWGYIDRKGEWAIQPRFADVDGFGDGLARAREGELYGYIDKQGQWVIEPRFQDPLDSASRFYQGRARVKLADGRAAWIDRAGKILWEETQGRP